MKLTKLELSGFKSFADTVTLNIEDGVTAIVGPNGCGKSNVSDAVRWVLGEQSARLLRGGKMEDVIFQGAASRRPVNVTEVSIYLDNSSGELPTPYSEVVITRRLSRSGQSEYLLNRNTARLRDIHDLLRGTGLGSNAGVVIEAKLIDLLLSDRADERRSLFEEAAGVGLYRDRRHATSRRLEETGGDLQRLEDLIAEVQSQIRSLARQKGKAERHKAFTEEKFAVDVALAQRQLVRLAADTESFEQRDTQLNSSIPAAREQLANAEKARESSAQERTAAELHRTTVADDLARARLEVGKLEGDLAVTAERLANAAERRQRAQTERGNLEIQLKQAEVELQRATEETGAAGTEHARIQTELEGRTAAEQEGRDRLTEQRKDVRELEHELQKHAETQRQLEGELAALEGEHARIQERLVEEDAHKNQLSTDRNTVGQRLTESRAIADRKIEDARHGSDASEQARLRLREARDREAREVSERRALEEELSALTARRSALKGLERDRVGVAPAAAALLGKKDDFGGGVLGTLADFISVAGEEAALAEQLLGGLIHAVLVKDSATVAKVQQWHQSNQPGTLVLLPVDSGPQGNTGSIDSRLRVEKVAGPWVAALVGGSEALPEGSHGIKRADGSIWLTGPGSTTGPLRRKAELRELEEKIPSTENKFESATNRQKATREEIGQLEAGVAETEQTASTLREAERQAIAAHEDLKRQKANLDRELQEVEAQLSRLNDRKSVATERKAEVVSLLDKGVESRSGLDLRLTESRARMNQLEGEQELAREARSEWQVQEAHLAARLRAATEVAKRSEQVIADSRRGIEARNDEITRLEAEGMDLENRRAEWQTSKEDRATTLLALETAAGEATGTLQAASLKLEQLESELIRARQQLESMTEEHHSLAVSVTEAKAERRRVVERLETEWKEPFAELVKLAPPVEADLQTLSEESERIASALEAIGIVNPLALEEHAEESKRLEFIQTQRDDLVAARQTLLQAIREIDGTAKALFTETFAAVRTNFVNVFQTLFGGGECDLRLSDPDDPLDSDIEIHAAPRGKRTQRIHLLSSGERTLVAASLLFSIYLTKPSPFCLMDEVDAPLDDANVGRFLHLLDEFKEQTQFIVITHNPRTMQSADSVYGVTMQEPGVSTIVGVRLGEHVEAS